MAYISSKRGYIAREEIFSPLVCRIIVSNGHHKCVIKTKKYGGQLRTVIKEELNSSLLNIGTVVATTVVGVISGKSKTIGKSFLGVAGYKMIENMLYKSKLEDIVEKFTLDYLGKREDD